MKLDLLRANSIQTTRLLLLHLKLLKLISLKYKKEPLKRSFKLIRRVNNNSMLKPRKFASQSRRRPSKRNLILSLYWGKSLQFLRIPDKQKAQL